MGKREHWLVITHPDDPPLCEPCGLEAIQKRGRWVCPIAWRNQHGYRGEGKRRSEHVVTASKGVITCSCGQDVEQLPNRTWVCVTQLKQALRGIQVQAETPFPGGFVRREGANR